MQCDREGCEREAQLVCAECYQGLWCSAECKRLDAEDHEQYDCYHPSDLGSKAIQEELNLYANPAEGGIGVEISSNPAERLTHLIASDLANIGLLSATERERRRRRRGRRRALRRRKRGLRKKRTQRRRLRRERMQENRLNRQEKRTLRQEGREERLMTAEERRYQQALDRGNGGLTQDEPLDPLLTVDSLFYVGI